MLASDAFQGAPIAFERSSEVRCSLDVEVDAPAGQSFTLESNEVAGSATLPAGYTATISRRVEG